MGNRPNIQRIPKLASIALLGMLVAASAVGGTPVQALYQLAIGGTHEPVTTAIGGTHDPVVTAIGGTHEPVTTAIGGTHEPVTTAIGGTHEPVTTAIGGTHELVITSRIDSLRLADGEVIAFGQVLKFDRNNLGLAARLGALDRYMAVSLSLLVNTDDSTIALVDFKLSSNNYVPGSSTVSVAGFITDVFPRVGKIKVGDQLVDYNNALSTSPTIQLAKGQFVVLNGKQPMIGGEFFSDLVAIR